MRKRVSRQISPSRLDLLSPVLLKANSLPSSLAAASLISVEPASNATGAGTTEARMSVRYNEAITFGRTGTARNLNCSGIDFDEDTGRSWTHAPVAELDCSLSFPRQDVLLEIEASPYLVPNRISVQKMFIYLGGSFIGYCALTGHSVREFLVNRNTIANRFTRLSLVIPTAVSPLSLGLSEDVRELGVCLSSILFKATT